MMVYLPQQIQLLAHQLRVAEPEEPEAEEFAVWNDLMPPANLESTPEPLNAEEILMLAEQTLKEAADKPIVIADEPTAFLTPELTMRMMELLRKQAEAGKTVLVTTRKPQVADYADQVIEIKSEK
jgi:predicted ATPase